MFVPVSENVKLSGKLYLPLLTTGSVPQLAMDLLINNLDLALIGVFHSRYLTPFIGQNAIDRSQELNCPVEIYSNSKLDNPICILQIRSAPLSNCWYSFYRELIAWLSSENVEVQVLASLPFLYKTDAFLQFTGSLPENLKEFNFLNLFSQFKIFIIFVNEGDNRQDSIAFLNFLGFHNDWKFPNSWKLIF